MPSMESYIKNRMGTYSSKLELSMDYFYFSYENLVEKFKCVYVWFSSRWGLVQDEKTSQDQDLLSKVKAQMGQISYFHLGKRNFKNTCLWISFSKKYLNVVTSFLLYLALETVNWTQHKTEYTKEAVINNFISPRVWEASAANTQTHKPPTFPNSVPQCLNIFKSKKKIDMNCRTPRWCVVLHLKNLDYYLLFSIHYSHFKPKTLTFFFLKRKIFLMLPSKGKI